MIEFIKGKLSWKSPTRIQVEVNGLGYGIHIPLSTFDCLPREESEVSLHTYLHVREDNLQIYGFMTLEEKELFLLLIGVPGIGPRTALYILSGLSVEELKNTVEEEDIDRLSSIPGIGRKTAQRLVVELKDKLAGESLKVGKEGSGMIRDAVKALVSLGCKIKEAQGAVKKAQDASSGELTLEELIKQAMKFI